MKRVLENDFLKVTIDDHGAELVSIYDKEKDREVIWQGDPRFWGRHAPVLFPNVGKHYGNHYRIGDKEYASKQHGFARDTDFTCIDSTLDSVTHQIRSTEETKEYVTIEETKVKIQISQEPPVLMAYIPVLTKKDR